MGRNRNMRISIIIPVYNVEAYLEMCIESVLAQKFTDYEVILVDDGSTDGSGVICDRYVQTDDRIRVIHQKNGGLSCARNVGARVAKGEYLFFLDSDDCIHPMAMQVLSDLASEHDADLVQLDIENVPADFTDFKKEIDCNYKSYVFDTIEAFYNIDRDNPKVAEDIRLVTTVAWSKLYRKKLFNQLSFPENMRLHEDQMVTHRFIVEAKGMVFCRAPLYFYRKRPNSLITVGWTVKRLAIFDCYEDRLKWVKKLQDGSKRAEELAYYIYIRYLVCMFKNYWMITKKLKGAERKNYQKEVITRFRKEMKKKEYKLKPKHLVVFRVFQIAPDLFVSVYTFNQWMKTSYRRLVDSKHEYC